MKIGIITYPFNANYGGLLQNYALQTVLKQNGYDVCTICNRKLIADNNVRLFFAVIIRFLKKYVLFRKGVEIFNEKIYNEENDVISQNTNLFKNKYLSICEYDNYAEELSEDEYDVLIVGSDQVWRKSSEVTTYYLDFAKDWKVKKIAYAASFGTSNWEYGKLLSFRCKTLAKKFYTISVREKDALQLCNDYLGVEAEWVLDPTLLLSLNNYNQLLCEKSNLENSYIFNYILDKNEDKISSLKTICNYFKCETISVNKDVVNRIIPVNDRIQSRVEDWLLGIKNSMFVFTDSFHGMVFSIIYEKPFIVYGNKGRGLARFESLLEYLDLKERIINSTQEITNNLLGAIIDYKQVRIKLEQKRVESIRFLIEAINN